MSDRRVIKTASEMKLLRDEGLSALKSLTKDQLMTRLLLAEENLFKWNDMVRELEASNRECYLLLDKTCDHYEKAFRTFRDMCAFTCEMLFGVPHGNDHLEQGGMKDHFYRFLSVMIKKLNERISTSPYDEEKRIERMLKTEVDK